MDPQLRQTSSAANPHGSLAPPLTVIERILLTLTGLVFFWLTLRLVPFLIASAITGIGPDFIAALIAAFGLALLGVRVIRGRWLAFAILVLIGNGLTNFSLQIQHGIMSSLDLGRFIPPRLRDLDPDFNFIAAGLLIYVLVVRHLRCDFRPDP